MGTKRSYVEVLHDEGYGVDLVWHMNTALNGKDMRAIRVVDRPDKTAIIFDNSEELKFYVLDGDYRQYQDVWINQYVDDDTKKQLQDELNSVFWTDDGAPVFKPVTISELQAAVRDGAHLVSCGLLY